MLFQIIFKVVLCLQTNGNWSFDEVIFIWVLIIVNGYTF